MKMSTINLQEAVAYVHERWGAADRTCVTLTNMFARFKLSTPSPMVEV